MERSNWRREQRRLPHRPPQAIPGALRRIGLVAITAAAALAVAATGWVMPGVASAQDSHSWGLFAEPVLPPPGETPWPEFVNLLRAAAGVPPVQQSQFGAHAAEHAARCLSNNGQPGNPHHLDPLRSCGPGVDVVAARIGAAASNISLRRTEHTSRQVLETLANRPFHAMSIFDPRIPTIDYASAFNPNSPLDRNRFVAATMVAQVRIASRVALAPVVSWPAPGWPVSGHFSVGAEWPSPLWPCGLEESGTPIWFATPDAEHAPNIGFLSLVHPDRMVSDDFCVYTSLGYVAADPAAQQVARGAMERMRAVVVIPRQPLAPGDHVLRGVLNGTYFERQITIADQDSR
jgi:hypothetical protein